MITVTPIQDKNEQQRLCALCDIPFDPSLLAYSARNAAGEFAGICQFKNDGDGGHIYHLAAPTSATELDPLFVMGRTALNFMDLCGIKLAFFDGEGVSDALLRRIGFAPDKNGRYAINLDGFFTKGCCH